MKIVWVEPKATPFLANYWPTCKAIVSLRPIKVDIIFYLISIINLRFWVLAHKSVRDVSIIWSVSYNVSSNILTVERVLKFLHYTYIMLEFLIHESKKKKKTILSKIQWLPSAHGLSFHVSWRVYISSLFMCHQNNRIFWRTWIINLENLCLKPPF